MRRATERTRVNVPLRTLAAYYIFTCPDLRVETLLSSLSSEPRRLEPAPQPGKVGTRRTFWLPIDRVGSGRAPCLRVCSLASWLSASTG